MIRAHVRFSTPTEAAEFVQVLNADGTTNKYSLRDNTNTYCADARSFLGVVYMMTDHNEHCYLINETNDGVFPYGIDKFRV